MVESWAPIEVVIGLIVAVREVHGVVVVVVTVGVEGRGAIDWCRHCWRDAACNWMVGGARDVGVDGAVTLDGLSRLLRLRVFRSRHVVGLVEGLTIDSA